LEVETVSEQLLFTTTYIESSFPKEKTSGTGFLYLSATDAGNQLFLVTNRHVVEDNSRGGQANKLVVKFIKADADGKPDLGKFTYVNFDEFTLSHWIGHPDPEIDLVIIPIGRYVEALNKMGQNPYFKYLTKDIVFQVGANPELDALEEVLFVGYPNGLFDAVNHLPLFRRGITASSVNIDFDGKPNFIIDAGVYPGSSGSPVFIHDQGWIRDRKGNVSNDSRTILLGIISKTYFRTTDAEIAEDTVALSAKVQEIIGLGIVIKARCIHETINAHLKNAGLTEV